jgi:hypothetical protein
MATRRKPPLDIQEQRPTTIVCSIGSATLSTGDIYKKGCHWYLPIEVESARFDDWAEVAEELIAAAKRVNANMCLEIDIDARIIALKGPRSGDRLHLLRNGGLFLAEVQKCIELRTPSGKTRKGSKSKATVRDQYLNGVNRVWGPEQRAAFRAARQQTA